MIIICLVVWPVLLHSVYTQGLSLPRKIACSVVLFFAHRWGVDLPLFFFRIENYPDLFIWRRAKATGSRHAQFEESVHFVEFKILRVAEINASAFSLMN